MTGQSAAIPSLAGAPWLAAPEVEAIFASLGHDGDEARIVGGAVRDALAGRPVHDLDFATTARPEDVVRRAGAAGFRTVPTGIAHGTVTIVADHGSYEVTTLREDVETDGRHAVVRYGRDWTRDAERRDFTVNALSVDAGGHVHDPLGGYPDILARRVRFIGDADRRIAEDRLRILRFFRFNATFGDGTVDRDGLLAAIRARDGLRALSAERVGQEMRRLVMAPGAAPMLELMQECGVLPVILAGVAYLGPFARMLAFEASVAAAASFPLRLAALGCRVEEDALRLAGRLRLANAERDLMGGSLAAAPLVPPQGDARAGRRLLYDVGESVYRGAVALADAWGRAGGDSGAHALYRLPDRWPRQKFPLSGRDVLGAGGGHGPAVGAFLKAVEAWWIAEDFGPDEAALRARLQQMIAAAQ